MSATLPAALALAGTALTAITIFAPFRASAPTPDAPATPDLLGNAVPWTVRVDPAATACDAHARADLAEALGALQTPWALAILHYAGEAESDPLVRSTIAAALSVSSSQSLVT